MEQYYQIIAEKTPHDKNRKLLDILYSKSENQLEIFINVVKTDHPDLHEMLVAEAVLKKTMPQPGMCY